MKSFSTGHIFCVGKMVDALVVGETHSSEKDYDSLMELDLSSFDAVFRESHDKDYFERDFTIGYTLFAIGHLLYGATLGRVYQSGDEFKEKVQSRDVPWHSVDAAVYDTFEMVSYWKRVLFLLLSPVGGAVMFGFLFQPSLWFLNRFAPDLVSAFSTVMGIGVVLLFSYLWAFSYFLLIEEDVMSNRDEYMASEVQRISLENDYESVLVSCGDKHRKGIASQLRESGWNVEEEGTESWFGMLLGFIDRVIAGILNPRRTVSRIASKIR